MLIKVVCGLLGLVVGGFQIIDGVHVLRTGTYIGPPTPGPWRHVVSAVGLDPFAMGPVFITLGSAWLLATGWLLVTSSTAAWWTCLAVAVLTLWYLPVGTVLSVVFLLLLVLNRSTLAA